MKTLLIYFLLLVVLGEGITLYLMNRRPPEKKILAEATTAATATPTITPTATATPTITPTSKPKPTSTKTPTPVPQPTVSSQQIYELINRFAGQYGVSPDVLRYMAICESGFNPIASHSKYAGLFQFNSPTWKNLRTEMGEDINPDLRFNAEEAVQTTAYAISKGRAYLWPNCYP